MRSDNQDRTEALARTFRMHRLLTLVGVVAFFFILFVFRAWGPLTAPWVQQRIGMAEFRQAAQERQILIEVARGELLAAEDQAAAIRTMGQSARDYSEYRTQQFIQAFSEALTNGKITKIIYVPTETSLPITEAGRMVEQ